MRLDTTLRISKWRRGGKRHFITDCRNSAGCCTTIQENPVLSCRFFSWTLNAFLPDFTSWIPEVSAGTLFEPGCQA